MYEAHFGLRRRPFPAVADSEYYYPATNHERALAALQQALDDDDGLALLSGEPGTGKTILCHCLLDRLGETVASAFLTHSHFPDRAALLQTLLYDLSLPYEGRSEQELRLSLMEFLLKNYAGRRRTLLIIDEAHHLGPALLEELRLLGNLEGRGGRAVHVLLVSQPAILQTLALPELAVVHQRLAVHARLEPLGLHEAADYVVHQLRAAGGRPERIISDEALEILVRASRGVPRLLNRTLHRALALTAAAGATLVDAEAALETLAVLDLAGDAREPAREAMAPSEPLRLSEAEGEAVLGLEETTEPASLALHSSASPRRPA